ncbi:MAG: cytochrome ubiquinol oxidase [Candidatus Kaiserbacteria bacterium]|nr:cytochrome ubiquinol oxidase [Candidatus Kaiserbacteria bacterium]
MLSTEARAEDNATLFGFWMYLMNDFVFFASLFAVYLVLRGNVFGSVGSDMFNMPLVLAESIALLTSSVTYGLALLAARREDTSAVLRRLCVTFVLGAAFLSMELVEFGRLIAAGHGPSASAFLSAYFTLIGAHGLHIAAGLIWMAALMVVILRRGLTRFTLRKLMLLGLFWHFLDLIWIFIFAIVYLTGII